MADSSAAVIGGMRKWTENFTFNFCGNSSTVVAGNNQGMHLNTDVICDIMMSVPQTVDVGTDLEGWTELDVHGGHEVLLL